MIIGPIVLPVHPSFCCVPSDPNSIPEDPNRRTKEKIPRIKKQYLMVKMSCNEREKRCRLVDSWMI